MAFQEAKESMSQIVRWTPDPKNADDKSIYMGPVITGYYVSMKTKVGQNESNLYEIELSEGPGVGQMISIWGSGLLDGKFAEIPFGCMVRVTSLGIAQPKTPKGRPYQNFKVEYDETSRRPMRAAGAPEATANPGVYQAPAAPVVPATAAPVVPATAAPVVPNSW